MRGRRTAAHCLGLVLTILCCSASRIAADDPEQTAQRAEAFLRDWVAGRARFDIDADLHAWASDAHRADSEHFEVGVKALALRKEGPAQRIAALAVDLVRRFGEEDADQGTRLRILRVLGRVAAPEGLPLLVEQSRSDDPERRLVALRSLGFFGKFPSEEGFTVFGGRVRYVVLPASPDERASGALLEALGALRRSKPATPGLASRQAHREQLPESLWAVEEALSAHRSVAVTSTVLDLLREPGSLRLTSTDLDSLADTLALSAPEGALMVLLGAVEDARADVRRVVVTALGLSGRREAVGPLLSLLDNGDDTLRRAAQKGLAHLAGERDASTDRTRAQWEALLGREGQRVEGSRAVHPRDLAPGVYRLGG